MVYLGQGDRAVLLEHNPAVEEANSVRCTVTGVAHVRLVNSFSPTSVVRECTVVGEEVKVIVVYPVKTHEDLCKPTNCQGDVSYFIW